MKVHRFKTSSQCDLLLVLFLSRSWFVLLTKQTSTALKSTYPTTWLKQKQRINFCRPFRKTQLVRDPKLLRILMAVSTPLGSKLDFNKKNSYRFKTFSCPILRSKLYRLRCFALHQSCFRKQLLCTNLQDSLVVFKIGVSLRLSASCLHRLTLV